MSESVMFDMNNQVIRSVHNKDVKYVNKRTKKVTSVDWDYWRYLVFSSVYGSLFKGKVNEVVLAIDSPDSWRFKKWPRYKEDRKLKKKKNDDEFPWKQFFIEYDEFMADIAGHLPVKVLKRGEAEADDIIGVVANKTQGNMTVISTDKDYLQLSSKRVKIYSPMKQQFVSHPNPEMFLIEQSLIGQGKDSIFNIKTPLDHPVGKRKPGFGPKAFEKVVAHGWKEWLTENNLWERYEFNRSLMDWRQIPQPLQDNIMDDYNNYKYPNPEMIWAFIKRHGWPEYIDNFSRLEDKFMQLY
jgi:hypothetical protein